MLAFGMMVGRVLWCAWMLAGCGSEPPPKARERVCPPEVRYVPAPAPAARAATCAPVDFPIEQPLMTPDGKWVAWCELGARDEHGVAASPPRFRMVNTRADEPVHDLVVHTTDEVKQVGMWMEGHAWRPVPWLRYRLDATLAEHEKEHTTRYLERWGRAGKYVGRGIEVLQRASEVVVTTEDGRELRRNRMEACTLAGARGGRGLGFVMLRVTCNGQPMRDHVLSLSEDER